MAAILVVDDNADLRRTMAQGLKARGYDVTEADDGGLALNVIESRLIDLVITDIVMPRREGMETIMELRKKHPGVKVIAMSGEGGNINAAGSYLPVALKLGAHGVLAKPFSLQQMVAKVQEVLGDPGPA